MHTSPFCLLLLACLFGVAGRGDAWAEMTLMRRQMFGSTGVLDAGSEGGGFQTVTGQFHQRPGGPAVGASAAASGDLRFESGSVYGKFVTEDTADGKFFLGGWFFVKSLRTGSAVWLAACDTSGNPGPAISESQGRLGAGILYGAWTPLPVEPVNQWIYLGIAVKRTAGSTGSVRFYYRFPGQPMTPWAAIDNAGIGIASLGQFLAGCDGNNPASQMRVGAPSLYKFESDDFSDVLYPADLGEPATGLTWYCDPAAGNDGNDGQTPATAWKTAAKINLESLYTGFFSAGSHAAGDTLVINTGGALLDLNSVALNFQTSGLNVRAAQGQEWIRIKSYRSLPAGVWTASGIPNVYATMDTQAAVVVWENDCFLNHPTGSSLQAVASSLASVPGSFWTDGTTLYLHPFGSTDPRSDGKRYERSCNWGTMAAVMLSARHLSVRDLHVGKTCLAASADNDPVGSYCLGTGSGLGQAVIGHCYLYCGSKHNFGITLGDAGDHVIIEDVQAEQGSPYAGPGGQTPFVSYNHQYAALGIVHSYRRCKTRANAGLIGSVSGTMVPYYPVFYSHNQGTPGEPDQFARLEFVDCDFGAGTIQGSATQLLKLIRTRCGEVTFLADVEAEQCEFRGMILAGAEDRVTERNCLHRLEGILSRKPLPGKADLRFCTFDARRISSIQGGVPDAALFNRTRPVELTFVNNAVLMPTAPVLASVFSGLQQTDLLTLRRNAYSLGGNIFVRGYEDGQAPRNLGLAAWKALGKDTGSLQAEGLILENNGAPKPGSQLIDAGEDAGPASDLTGKVFRVRDDIGAVEAPPSSYEAWRLQNFDDEWLAQRPALTREDASVLGDGVSNLEKYFAGLTPWGLGKQAGLEVGRGAGGLWEIRLPRARYALDVEMALEKSRTLTNWSAVTESPEVVDVSPEASEMIFRFPLSIGSRCYFRVRLLKN
ncbi:MAG: hypothetical protein V4599_03440 [Verrucomicrobiota bacterium]